MENTNAKIARLCEEPGIYQMQSATPIIARTLETEFDTVSDENVEVPNPGSSLVFKDPHDASKQGGFVTFTPIPAPSVAPSVAPSEVLAETADSDARLHLSVLKWYINYSLHMKLKTYIPYTHVSNVHGA